MTSSPPRPPRQQFVLADRRLARAILIGLACLFCIAIIGPLISFRSDVANSRHQRQTRVAREATVFAESLKLLLDARIDELERVASRPEVDLADGNHAPEERLLTLSHRGSALFKCVGFLGTQGNVVWAEPHEPLRPVSKERWQSQPWFQHLLAEQEPVVEIFDTATDTLVAGVPVVRGGQLTGVLVGLMDASEHLVPVNLFPEETALLVARSRRVLQISGKGSVFKEELTQRLPDLPAIFDDEGSGGPGTGMEWELANDSAFAFFAPVKGSYLTVVLVDNEEPVLATLRGRLLYQLLFIASLQVASVLLFSLYLGRSYQRFLKVEAQIADNEKMIALGHASALIAHEVKNSLNGLSAATSYLSLDANDPVPAVRIMRGQIERLEHVARLLLDFAKPMAPRLVDCNLERLAHEAIEGLQLLPEAESVKVNAELDTPLPVRSDPLLLLTAIENLVRNAIEAGAAAKDTGRIAEPWVRVRGTLQAGTAILEIEDNAGGPPPEFEQTMFEPFATSKPKGIGLGLTMAFRAIESQGGMLEFARTPAGSRFTIRVAARTSESGRHEALDLAGG
ncbi:MAG TPA: ATP-binding protein [Polyangia bacterium]|nr:ATP-binding protein [Polyangia bacterium]